MWPARSPRAPLGSELDRADRADIAGKVREAAEAAREEVWGGHRFVVIADTSTPDGLKVIDLGAGHSSSSESLCGRVISALKSSALLSESVGAGYLERNWPPALKDDGAWPLVGLRQCLRCRRSRRPGRRCGSTGTSRPEVWNRLGTRLLPKLRSGRDLRVGVVFELTADGPGTDPLSQTCDRSWTTSSSATASGLTLTERLPRFHPSTLCGKRAAGFARVGELPPHLTRADELRQ